MNRRGSILPIVALGLAMVMVLFAGMIDVGLAAVWKAEVQRTADAAALAGAQGLVRGDIHGDSARSWAYQTAASNPVNGHPAVVEILAVDLVNAQVTVQVLYASGPMFIYRNGLHLRARATAGAGQKDSTMLATPGGIQMPPGNAWGWWRKKALVVPALSDTAMIRLVE